LSSGEGVIWEVRDQIIKMAKEGKGAGASLVEEVVDHGVPDKRLLVIESEFSGALRVMQREGNILSRVLRDAWDRGDLATMTKNSPARATGAGISIVGHITAAELRECLDRTDMANGFANRFLFACVRRPDARFDCMGLVLLLDRCEIIGIDEDGADLVTETGTRQRYRRRPLPVHTVSLWVLGSDD
jgi:hypothetical protein